MNCENLMMGDWVEIVANDGYTYTGKVDSVGFMRDANGESVVVGVLNEERIV